MQAVFRAIPAECDSLTAHLRDRRAIIDGCLISGHFTHSRYFSWSSPRSTLDASRLRQIKSLFSTSKSFSPLFRDLEVRKSSLIRCFCRRSRRALLSDLPRNGTKYFWHSGSVSGCQKSCVGERPKQIVNISLE